MKKFNLTVSSPDGNIFEGEAVKLDVRGAEGELAVMAGHIPFVTSLKPCEISVWLDEETNKKAYSEGGLLTVSDTGVTLLAGSFRFSE